MLSTVKPWFKKADKTAVKINYYYQDRHIKSDPAPTSSTIPWPVHYYEHTYHAYYPADNALFIFSFKFSLQLSLVFPRKKFDNLVRHFTRRIIRINDFTFTRK